MKIRGLFDSGFLNNRLHYLVLIAGSAGLGFMHPLSAAVMLGVTLLYIGIAEIARARAKRSLTRYIDAVKSHLDTTSGQALERIPFPVLVVGGEGSLIWYNEAFASIAGGVNFFGKRLSELAPGLKETDWPKGIAAGLPVFFNGRQYNVYHSAFDYEGAALRMLYWVDDTRLYQQKLEHERSRPVICHIFMDNYDELTKNATEGDRSNLAARFFEVLSAWAAPTGGVLRPLDRFRYMLLFEHRHLETFIEGRFSVLETVRSITFGKMSATLSLGLGTGGGSLRETDEYARRSLDMALGRGGDQAVLCTKAGFEFFGGRIKSPERRSRVKSRVIANVLSEMMDDCDNVLIMGHRYADFDCLGASAGIYRIARSRGRDARIVMDLDTCLVREMAEAFLMEEGEPKAIVPPPEALQLVMPRTILFVVDTQRQTLTELPELLGLCRSIVIMDHHRRSVDTIDNILVNHHDPHASATSEMVTELAQYALPEGALTRLDAQLLLAGIMLDTKTFTVKAGVRTFEAAAYLRQMGADPAEIRRYFSNDMESYRIKAQLISHSQLYRDSIAIALWDSAEVENIKQICGQTADEMLNITDVSAAFVVVPVGSQVHVSARSSGEINVQLIMERMGGGGNFATAGVQLSDISVEEARQRLMHAIDSYYASL